MRVFLAGATGVIGQRLAVLLRDAKHEIRTGFSDLVTTCFNLRPSQSSSSNEFERPCRRRF